jgi:hypothetical protein
MIIPNIKFKKKSIKKIHEIKWNKKIELLENYILKFNKKPSCKTSDKNIQDLGRWTAAQIANIKKNRHAVSHQNQKQKWDSLVTKYNKLFMSRYQLWNYHFDNLKQYISEYNKFPPKNKGNKLGIWFSTQKYNYKKKINIYKDEFYCKKWEEFINQYKINNTNSIYTFEENINNLQDYIDKYKKRPTYKQKEKNKKYSYLALWIYRQNRIQSTEWLEFCEKNKYICILNDKFTWDYYFYQIKTFVNTYNKLPTNGFLSKWLDKQIKNIDKSKNISEWNIFYEQNKILFSSNNKISDWIDQFQKVKIYTELNGFLPSALDKRPEIIKINNWLSRQEVSYKLNKGIMKDEIIRNKWIQFISKFN